MAYAKMMGMSEIVEGKTIYFASRMNKSENRRSASQYAVPDDGTNIVPWMGRECISDIWPLKPAAGGGQDRLDSVFNNFLQGHRIKVWINGAAPGGKGSRFGRQHALLFGCQAQSIGV